MPPAPKVRALLALLGLIACLQPALAHDVDVTGVARVFLDQRGANEYHLSVVDQQVPPLFNIERILPERCSGLPPGPFSYRFQCEPALHVEDTLDFPWTLEGVVVIARWQEDGEVSAYFTGDGSRIEVPLSELKAGSVSVSNLARRYSILGAEHILFGLDHLLFVLGLLLLQHSFWKLIQTITAFTVAHSVTLACAVLGIFPAPNAPIEVLIALSIAFLAREVITGLRGEQTLVHRWPWLVALLFGLFHGFGFAGALGELGLSDRDIPLALLFFNLGVEAGQVAFICLLVALHETLKWLSSAMIPAIQRGLAYGLGCIATFWFLERLPALIGTA